MKRILACDGGGIGALFTLQVLARIEALFREERRQPALVLREAFDFFAGTSTGAIIAAGLAWGLSVAEIERLYIERCREIFRPVSWLRRLRAWYDMRALADLFRGIFHEDDEARTPSLLGTKKLEAGGVLKYLLVVCRNASTGSPWPITNNPNAVFNDPALADCNLQIPIWRLLRASTAAPTYFLPEVIHLGGRPHLFVDGGITPFNNPALIAALMATLPAYRMNWETGVDRLMVVSVGTGFERVRYAHADASRLHLLHHVQYVPAALIASGVQEQDLMCRVLGECRFGAGLDAEVGDLIGAGLLRPEEKKFAYMRYNRQFDPVETEALFAATGQKFTLDNVELIPYLREIGQRYADASVRREHFF